MKALPGLKPAFQKDGTVTAANASGINDGAAARRADDGEGSQGARAEAAGAHRVLGARAASIRRSWARARSRPRARRWRRRAGRPSDLDLVEANEAFAAQACAVNKDMGWDTSKVNVNGGAIAIGHPIGASGARVLDHAAASKWPSATRKKGLATLCIGGGMGIAMCVER